MTQFSETELIEALKRNVLQISFKAVDGSDKVMLCTLNELMIPVSERITPPTMTYSLPQASQIQRVVLSPDPMSAVKLGPKPKISTAVRVYSTDRAGWRSVKPESITDVSIVHEL